MFTPFVISQPNDDYRIQVIRSQIIGFEIHKKHDSDEFYVHSVIVGGATGPGGLYSNKTKAESVVNLFCCYLNDYDKERFGKNFIFPDDKSIDDNGKPIDEEEKEK